MNKSRVGWAEYVTRIGEMINTYKILVRRPEQKIPLGRVHGKIILEWISGKYDGKLGSGFIWLWIDTSGGLL
jgi:hypothetical protein